MNISENLFAQWTLAVFGSGALWGIIVRWYFEKWRAWRRKSNTDRD